MDRDRREIVLSQNFIKFDCILNALDKDYNLIEHERVKQLSELSDLLIIFKLDIVLLESVKSQLALVIYEDFKLVLHKLSADVFHVVRHGCREHHDLLLVRCLLENLLNISSHIYNRKFR